MLRSLARNPKRAVVGACVLVVLATWMNLWSAPTANDSANAGVNNAGVNNAAAAPIANSAGQQPAAAGVEGEREPGKVIEMTAAERVAELEQRSQETVLVNTLMGYDILVHGSGVDKSVSASIVKDRAYGKDTVDFLDAQILAAETAIGAKPVVLDIGANVMYHSLQAARLGARVIAWECLPDNYRLARASLRLNGWENQVSIVTAAASTERGEAVLSLTPNSPGATTFGKGKDMPWDVDTIKIKVPVAPALDALKDLGVSTAHVIKVDVEGHELYALKGLGDLRALGVRALVLEFFPALLRANDTPPADLLRYLLSQGFEIHSKPSLSDTAVDAADVDSFVENTEKGLQHNGHTDLYCIMR